MVKAQVRQIKKMIHCGGAVPILQWLIAGFFFSLLQPKKEICLPDPLLLSATGPAWAYSVPAHGLES